MAFDERLAERVRQVLKQTSRVVEKRMFGGICFMVDGNMCCGVERERLMVRVGPKQYAEALAEPHAKPMDFTGRPLKGFVYVDAKACASDALLKQWIERGLAFVRSLPKK